MMEPLHSSELLRTAHEKEALAANFETHAKRLEITFSNIPTNPGQSDGYWKGPAADRYIEHALRLRRELDELAESCLATARNLRRQASILRERAERESG
jgi:uncharacterized protein YukE